MKSVHALLLGAAVLAPLSPAFATDTAPAATAASAPPAKPAGDQAKDDQPRQEIVVTASPFDHAADETPAITAQVNSDDILKSGGSNISDALSKVPGVSGTGFAAGASRPIVRGMDANRVRILENGTSMSDVSDIGPDHGVPFDPLAARSIEVVRGAGTLRYGSQAIGGVVNAINNRVPTSLPSDPIAAELTGSYGSGADAWQGSGLVDARVGNLAVHADAFIRDTGDYATPLGPETNSFFRGHGGALGGSYFFGGGDSHMGVAIEKYASKYGIPGETSYIDMTQTKLVTRSSFALGTPALDKLTLDGSYADYQHSEIDGGAAVATFKNREYDVRGELLFNPFGPINNSAVGFEYQHRNFSALGDASNYLLPTTTAAIAGYAFIDTEIADVLHLETAGRIERITESGTPVGSGLTQRAFTPLSGAVGLLLEPGDVVKLGVTFSSTGRAPSITELFARGAHDGPNTYETGDPDLLIERANSLEGTLRVHAGAFHFEGSVYSSWFNNYIFGDLTGLRCDDAGVCGNNPDEKFKQLFYRQQSAHFRGVEGKASLTLVDDFAGKLEASVLGDYTRATLGDGSNVPRIPPYRIGGGLDWQSDRFDAGVTLIYSGKQDKFGAYDTPTPGFYALSAQLAWRPFVDHPGIEFALSGQNLTDAVQRNAASLNKDEVVLPGRSVNFIVKIAT